MSKHRVINISIKFTLFALIAFTLHGCDYESKIEIEIDEAPKVIEGSEEVDEPIVINEPTPTPTPTPIPIITLVVEHKYSVNGDDWNDYIKDDGSNVFTATDTTCDLDYCIHGAEILKATVDGVSSCDNSYTIYDSLGAFNWSCQVVSESATIFSTGLKDGKGLADIINSSSWKNNSLIIASSDGNIVAQSTSASWWNNQIIELPDNAATAVESLTDSKAIYTLSADRETMGYNIDADKISVVTLDGAILKSAAGVPDNCHSVTGKVTTPDLKCVISSGGRNFIWIEGDIDNTSEAERGVLSIANRFSRFNNLSVQNSTGPGFVLMSESGNDDSHMNKVTNILSANNSSYGIHLNNSDYNEFKNIRTYNNGNHGIYSQYSDFNTITGIISTNNTGDGVQLYQSLRNTILNSTISSNGGSGFSIYDPRSCNTNIPGLNDFNTVVNIVSHFNGVHGISFTRADFNIFSQVISSDNTNQDLYYTGCGSYRNAFQNNALFSGTAGSKCQEGGGDNEIGGNCNVVDTSANATLPQPLTAVNIIEDNSLATSFLGNISTNDQVNQSNDSNGLSIAADILDWVNFENIFRNWGKEALTVGGCTGGVNCSIKDYRTVDEITNVLYNRTYDGVNQNEEFFEGTTCPRSVHGDVTISDMQASQDSSQANNTCLYRSNCDGLNNIFLVNSIEIISDGIGDDDGLCESNEACIYSPNFGAYQGSGNLSESCLFEDGIGNFKVINVTMYAYGQ